jgi:hypothetical protein
LSYKYPKIVKSSGVKTGERGGHVDAVLNFLHDDKIDKINELMLHLLCVPWFQPAGNIQTEVDQVD